jgi:hypothetical protein
LFWIPNALFKKKKHKKQVVFFVDYKYNRHYADSTRTNMKQDKTQDTTNNMRFFNTAGPVNEKKHYTVPPLQRFDLFEIETLIAQEKYFVLHAPRQTGKTTSMLTLVDYLNAGGRYRALYCNVETAQTAREDVAKGMQSILSKPQLAVANPIYREIIPRMLTYSTQITLSHQTAWYITPENRLDMDKLMAAFQQFFQEHSAHWLERFQYKEAGPQLLLQAFLQRVINSGGRIEREYGPGRQRVDLLVLWPLEPAQDEKEESDWTRWQGPVQKVVVELKVLHKILKKTLASGLEQTYSYMDTCGTKDGHLVIFNRDAKGLGGVVAGLIKATILRSLWVPDLFVGVEPRQIDEMFIKSIFLFIDLCH